MLGRARACRRRAPPSSFGTAADSSFACFSASNVSCGKARLGVDVGGVLRGDLLSDGAGQARDFISRRHGQLL